MNSRFRWIVPLFVLFALQGCLSTSDPSWTAEQNQEDVSGLSGVVGQDDPYLSSKKPLRPQQKAVVVEVKTLMKNKQWQEARAILAPLLSAKQLPSDLWLVAGDIERGQGGETVGQSQVELLQQAIHYYQSALAANNKNYHALNRLGATSRELGQFQHALAYYDRAINIRPTFAKAYLNRGILHDLYLGNKPSAVKDYQQYQALNRRSQQGESRLVKGWLADLNRQLASINGEQNDGR